MSSVSRRRVVRTSIALVFLGAASACSDSSKVDEAKSMIGGGSGTSTASAALLKPDKAAIAKPAPDSFRVAVETSKGNFTILVHRDWAPNGADRFYHLVDLGFFDDARFFRVLQGFMAQFGVNGDPKVSAAWEELNIQDDPVKQSNKRGMVTFAQSSAPNTRSTQLFINYVDNANLDGMGFAPIGEVVEGMAAVDSLYGEYGEGYPQGGGPDQMKIVAEGNKYLNASFPKLDFIRKARIVSP